MPTFQDIQNATRTVPIEPFLGFKVDVKERLARDPELEKRERARLVDLAAQGQKAVEAIYASVVKIAKEGDANRAVAASVEDASQQKAKGKKGAVTTMEEPDPASLMSPNEEKTVAFIRGQVLAFETMIENDERMRTCVAVVARVADWDLTDGPVKKIPLTSAEELYSYVDEKGRGVSTDLLDNILTKLDEAQLIPNPSS